MFRKNTNKTILISFVVFLAVFVTSYSQKAHSEENSRAHIDGEELALGRITHGEFKKSAIDFSDRRRWEKMRRNDSPDTQSQLVDEILFISDTGKLLASLEWLRDLIKSGKETDYVYPYMYAIQLHRSKYPSTMGDATALAMSYYSKLLLMTDAARCDDNGVGASRLANLSKTLGVVDKETKRLPHHIKYIMLDTILTIEEKYKDRSKQPVICKTGIGFMARAMQSKKTKKVETIAKKGNKQGHIAGSRIITVVLDEDIEVYYISDEEWHKKREKIRASMLRPFKK